MAAKTAARTTAPAAGPPAASEPARPLTRSSGQRCRAYLELRAPPSDCPYFLDHLSPLWTSKHTDAERALQCAAYLRSLAATPNPTDVEPRPPLGRHCTRWVTTYPQACLTALRAGEPHARACDRIADNLADLRAIMRSPDIDPDLVSDMQEFWCGFRLTP
ncbi:MAG TPA: hypothetical protein VIK91_06780 [Nannocystis sp.]